MQVILSKQFRASASATSLGEFGRWTGWGKVFCEPITRFADGTLQGRDSVLVPVLYSVLHSKPASRVCIRKNQLSKCVAAMV